MSAFDFTGVGCWRRGQECVDELPRDKKRVAVAAIGVWCDGPLAAGEGFVECSTKQRESFLIERRAIDGRDDGGVAAESERFAEADLQ